MYAADTIERKQNRADQMVGCLVVAGLICLAIYNKKSVTFEIMFLGVVVLGLVAMLVGILIHRHINKTYKLCIGETAEIRGGRVTGYFKDPFVYRKKDLLEENIQLVPISNKPYSASETIKIVASGNIVTCTLRCGAEINDFQNFYNAFLRTEFTVGKLLKPEGAMEYQIMIFLVQKSVWLTELYQEENISDDRRGEYVEKAIKRRATECLRLALSPYGLRPRETSVTCSAWSCPIV